MTHDARKHVHTHGSVSAIFSCTLTLTPHTQESEKTECTLLAHLFYGRSRLCMRLLDFHIILREELFYTVKLNLYAYVFTMLYSTSHTVLINSILIINNLLKHSSSGKSSQCIKRDFEIGIFLPALCLSFSHLSSFKPDS